MPIGIPRVPHRFPGEPYTQWINIYERLITAILPTEHHHQIYLLYY